LGIGDWGLGIGANRQSPIPNAQSPIPNPQSPIPNPHTKDFNIIFDKDNKIKNKKFFINNKLVIRNYYLTFLFFKYELMKSGCFQEITSRFLSKYSDKKLYDSSKFSLTSIPLRKQKVYG